MDYPVQLTRQLQPLLKSLRKSRQMTQAELARRLGVVQSRVADIERDPGAVSVEQLLQVLSLLGAQLLIRESAPSSHEAEPGVELRAQANVKAATPAALAVAPRGTGPSAQGPLDGTRPDEPRGQW
ncbi:MAG: hypothetical protein RLY78_2959 [Pseudomonadota bacterium]